MARRKILLVDDDRDLLRLVSLRLEAAGYEVVVAESGEEALVQLDIGRPEAVVTDLRMRGIDGLALVDAIHERQPAMPIIILTAHGSIPDAVTATRQGVFAFLTKPFDGQILLGHIEQALRLGGDANVEREFESWRLGIVTRNPEMEEILRQAKLVADGDVSVLLRGASGTGKELLARAIHLASPRHQGEFVALNCAAVPESLLESELFGYAKGAFTGAIRDYAGLFQTAHRGTLFLDEIGDMPLALQAKLLRVLEEHRVRPIGATRQIDADVRIISATHRDLDAELASARFREDLYYRLNVVVLELPPLDRRREDIPLLATRRLAHLSTTGRKHVSGFSPEALELLVRADWPGNVRQLFNVIDQAYALSTTPLLSDALIRKALRDPRWQFPPLEQARIRFEKEYLVRLLKITHGNVARAARMAQRNRTEFYKLMHRHQLSAAPFKSRQGEQHAVAVRRQENIENAMSYERSENASPDGDGSDPREAAGAPSSH